MSCPKQKEQSEGKRILKPRTNKTSRTLNPSHVISVGEDSHLNTKPNAKPEEQHVEIVGKRDTLPNAATVLKLPMSNNENRAKKRTATS